MQPFNISQVSDVAFKRRQDNHFPYISLKVSGEDASIGPSQKQALLKLGIVRIDPPSVWAARLPVLHMDADPETGRSELNLEGYVYSPELVALFRQFYNLLEMNRYEEGPVDFP